MHDTARYFGKLFLDTYVGESGDLTYVEIGSGDINGSFRKLVASCRSYVGLDLAAGQGVDAVMGDAGALPIADNAVDVCVSSSSFEHTEFFWLLFNEIQRILKPGGLFYLNVPANGIFHRHPVDCWRFYPDSGIALQNWARRNGHHTLLLESFTGNQKREGWNDFVAVFIKDARYASAFPDRMLRHCRHFTNGRVAGTDGFLNPATQQEDQRLNPHKRMARLAISFISWLLRPFPASIHSAGRAFMKKLW
jgi:SAM-dependent methyltransferase